MDARTVVGDMVDPRGIGPRVVCGDRVDATAGVAGHGLRDASSTGERHGRLHLASV